MFATAYEAAPSDRASDDQDLKMDLNLIHHVHAGMSLA